MPISTCQRFTTNRHQFHAYAAETAREGQIHTPQPLQAQLLSQVQLLAPEQGQEEAPQLQPILPDSVDLDFGGDKSIMN